MLVWYSRWKFTFLLIALVGLLIVQSFFEDFFFHQGFFHLLYTLTLLAAILAFADNKRLRYTLIVLAIFAALGSWSAFSLGDSLLRELAVIDRGAGILFLGLTTAAVLRRVITEARVTIDTLMGSACAYLLIAAVWGLSYSALEYAQPGTFTVAAASSQAVTSASNFNDWLYYSFMTLTTLGYSDILPNLRAAGTLTWLEAMAGQFYLAILVARLVGLHLVPVTATK